VRGELLDLAIPEDAPMPMYDYLCPHCGEAFEELRSIAERKTAECPSCGKTAQKQVSGFFTSGSRSTPSSGSCGLGNLGGG
jgi:putative FmdB family regulatory protein